MLQFELGGRLVSFMILWQRK